MTISLSGRVGAVCVVAPSGGPVLLIEDDAVCLRLDFSGLDAVESAAAGGSLLSAVDDLCGHMAVWALRNVGPEFLPPPPYARGGGADE